jgi:hypothetical protein
VIEQAAYANHGADVRCVTEVVNRARRAGDLRGSLASGIVRKAARSSVGQARVAEREQSFFDLVYAGLRAGPPPTPVLTGAARTLTAFDAPPYWNVSRNNCDAGELTAGACIGLDGTAIEIAPVPGRGGAIVAVDPVPRGIRPPSNFEWRSNPYSVNGGGGDRLNPGGDFRGAYWLGRFLVRGQDGSINLAQGARGR